MISLNYDPYALTFSNSRKNLKWLEIEYFLKKLKEKNNIVTNVLDIWCGNWRLVSIAEENTVRLDSYLWIDSSEVLLWEARKMHPEVDFLHLDMLNLEELKWQTFTDIFLIASFHHLETIKQRQKVMADLFDLLEEWGNVYMTNWALESPINYMKYVSSAIDDTENEFWSKDFKIKIWEHDRFYHSFTEKELEFLSEEAWFVIEENREFENQKNTITILKKV